VISATAHGRVDVNARPLIAWLWAGAVLGVGALIYLLLNKPIFYSALLLFAPVAVFIVMHPRLALVQFIFALFIELMIIPAIPLYLIDLSALLLVASATVDVLASNRLPTRIPRLTWNFVYIMAALVVCAVLGHWPALVIRRLLSLGFLVAVFWSVYRLSGQMTIRRLIDWFLLAATINAVYVLVPYLASGGTSREFGFSGVLFDDMALVAMPVGLALFLGAENRRAPLYLASTVLCLGGLVATQCRLSIMFGLAAAVFVLVMAFVRASRAEDDPVRRRAVRRKVLLLVLAGAGLAAIIIAAKQGLFAAVLERFVQMVENPFDRYSTVNYRITLWKRALVAWADHPVFGVGPGGFVHLYELYPSSRLTFDYHIIGHLGAHNLLLDYLAGSGLVGAAGLLALMANKFVLARRSFLQGPLYSLGERLALYAWAAIFVATCLIEGNWMWGQLSFLMIFFAALISRQYANLFVPAAEPPSH